MKKKQLMKILKYEPDTGVFYKRSSGKAVGKFDSSDGYVYIYIGKKKHRADKLAWLYLHGSWPKHDINHRDGVKSNNWASNLEKKKSYKQRNNKTGITGVSWDKRDKKFRAQIQVDGNLMNLGNYDKIEKAILARHKAEKLNNFPAGTPAENAIKNMFL